MVSTAVGFKVGASVAVEGLCVSVGSAVTEGPGPQPATEVTVKSNATIVRHLIRFLFLFGKVS